MENYYVRNVRNLAAWYLFLVILYSITVFGTFAGSLTKEHSNLTSSNISDRHTTDELFNDSSKTTAVKNVIKANATNVAENSTNINVTVVQTEGGHVFTTTRVSTEDSRRPQSSRTDNIAKAVLEGGDVLPLSSINTKSDHVKSINIELLSVSTELDKTTPTTLMNVHPEAMQGTQNQHHQTLGRKGVVFNNMSAIYNEAKQTDNNKCVCCPNNITKTVATTYNCTMCCDSFSVVVHNQNVDLNYSKNNSEVRLKDNSVISSVDSKTKPSVKNVLEITTQITKETTISSTDIQSDVYQASSPLKKKNKPTFTLDEAPTNLPMQFLQSSVLSPESSYIIPVVAVILTAPLIIVLALFLYKRGKEFWERRHYRRMDFLVDGMYND